MATVKMSAKFQVVTPRDVREALGLKAGQKLVVFRFENRIEMIPAEPIRKLRGFARGIDTSVPRDEDGV
ncbi:MAG: AbrB family transcriptional regulator [Acidobacteria bacterium]|nr:MAG: AbrB family transcriptional regulator [Acidobacteriota bacterium]